MRCNAPKTSAMRLRRCSNEFRSACSPFFDGGNAGRCVDELLIEPTSVVADRFDLALEPRFVFEGPSLLAAQPFQLPLARIEGIQAWGFGLTLWSGGLG